MKRLYISGPMSGLPESNYPAFNAAAAALRAKGYQVENPAENAPQPDWASYMHCALEQVLRCDEVWLLPGWEQSSGAVGEASIAQWLGMPLEVITKCDGGWLVTRNLVDADLAHLVRLPAPGELRRATA
jgi:hypothetical protein